MKETRQFTNTYPDLHALPANITTELHEPESRNDLKTYLKVLSTIMQEDGRYR
ncbi:hypothetical protein [Secundilactobacillus paracollinoides]|uniref:hypothetical protein n=1 Tax=Secundilactobacillus paracollinoides TaxID=240427 RepID=UPI0006F00339|nr:hypothetical protein [Secundilactobacillus paracollinoides]KRL75036.1 hypothetical protein FC17_GL002932 [Secundilactobacillus paracollinoides DSM 15502 = JCM 11969]